MSLPSFPDIDKIPSREQVINLIISSIAMEELGLSHIINAEGEKLQYALGTIPGMETPDTPLTMDELLKLNDSVKKTLDSTMMNQFFLKEKLMDALSAAVMQGPPGERGPQGPATITVDPDVEHLAPGESPYVDTSQGTEVDVVLKFGIPSGDVGPVGTILDSYDTFDDLIQEHERGQQGDAYLVGGVLYVWDTEAEQWTSVGNLQGPQGETGTGTTIKGTASSKDELDNLYPSGPPEDAYLVNGEIFIWNPTDMWHSGGNLQGPVGPAGAQGPAGEQGLQGATGLQGVKGDPGQTGVVKGTYADEETLRNEHTPGVEGEFYLVGTQATGYHLWIWDPLALPDGEWVDAGVFNALEGPMGPQGPQGEQGPAGHFTTGDELFTITGEAGSGVVPMGFEGTLSFKSDTLDITMEAGPAVRIEQPYSLGTLLHFSSGDAQTFTTGISGGRFRVVIVGQCNNHALTVANDPIDITTAPEFAFPMPAKGIINAVSLFFTLSASTGLLFDFNTRVKAALFRSSNPPDNTFYLIPETETTVSVPNLAMLGTSYAAETTGLSVELEAGERIMLVVYTETAPEYAAGSTITGFVSAGVRLL